MLVCCQSSGDIGRPVFLDLRTTSSRVISISLPVLDRLHTKRTADLGWAYLFFSLIIGPPDVVGGCLKLIGRFFSASTRSLRFTL